MTNMTQTKPGISHRDDAQTGPEKTNTERFQVSYTIDYGYRLHPEDDFNKIIIPEFISERTVQDFNVAMERFLIEGKRIYCNCTGEHYKRDGADFYKVREAHLFAK